VAKAVIQLLSAFIVLSTANFSYAQNVAIGNSATVELQLGRNVKIPLQNFPQSEVDIDLDGELNEAVWSRIAPFNGLRIIEPDTLEPAPYPTDARIFYTSRGLYMSFDMTQPVASLIQRISSRDNIEINRDTITVTLDTSGEGLFGYWMMLALGDNQADGTVLPERQYRTEWDGAWNGATAITAKGWSAEFFVPWGQMAMPRAEGARQIGINVVREVAYLDQSWAWPGIPDSEAIFMSNLPLLELDGVSPRQQWSLFPYVATTLDQIDNTTDSNTGFDVFWRPSSNFQLTGTVNPDFGSAESDNVDVNLTANETFFPEKRLFFQEGQEIFNTTPRSTGSNGKRFTIVNTRRIGGRPRRLDLPPGESLTVRDRIRPADLDAALKMTGQVGAVRYGLLAAVEDDTEYKVNNVKYLQDGRDFTAFRVIYEDSSEGAAYRGLGYIGSLVQHPESDAEVHAVDFHYLTSGGKWNVDGQWALSDSDDVGRGQGGFADIVYTPRQGFRHNLQLTYMDDKLDVTDFGFQERNNMWEAWYRFEWVKSDLKLVRNFRFSPFLRYEENLDGDRTNNAIPVMSMSVTLNNLDRINLGFQYFPKRYDDQNSFGNGTFEIAARTNMNIGYTTNTAKTVSYNVGIGTGNEFAGGDYLNYDAGVTWRPRENINLSTSVSYNDRNGWLLHQEKQNFTTFNADQWRTDLNLDYFLTAKQQFRMALQWVGIRALEDEFFYLPSDAVTRNRDLNRVPKPAGPTDNFSISQLNFQLRYRWQIAPLSDLFVVYTKGDNRRIQLTEFNDLFENSWDNPLGDSLVIKLRYRLGT